MSPSHSLVVSKAVIGQAYHARFRYIVSGARIHHSHTVTTRAGSQHRNPQTGTTASRGCNDGTGYRIQAIQRVALAISEWSVTQSVWSFVPGADIEGQPNLPLLTKRWQRRR